MIPIKEAVLANVDQSREIYDWVWKLCTGLGAEDAGLVPFEKYAKAAEGPSSESTVWSGASPANKDSSRTRSTRSSKWSTSAWEKTARQALQRSTDDRVAPMS